MGSEVYLTGYKWRSTVSVYSRRNDDNVYPERYRRISYSRKEYYSTPTAGCNVANLFFPSTVEELLAPEFLEKYHVWSDRIVHVGDGVNARITSVPEPLVTASTLTHVSATQTKFGYVPVKRRSNISTNRFVNIPTMKSLYHFYIFETAASTNFLARSAPGVTFTVGDITTYTQTFYTDV